MPTFAKTFPIHSYEIDHRGYLRPVALLNFLQDAAGDHAERLGVSVRQLMARNLTWLLTRYRVRFRRHAREGERLEVRTWPSSREGLQVLRQFEVRDGAGEAVAVASTAWMVLDLATRRTARPSECLPAFAVHPEAALEEGFSALKPVARPDRELPFRVRLGDLDLNQHVNNAVYVEWALETVAPEVLERCAPSEIEVAYRAEAFHPDLVLSRAEAEAAGDRPRFLHQLASEGSGRELTRLRTAWVPVEG